MCTCYLAAFITVSWVFHKDPGVPLVCLTIGSSLGQFVVPSLYEVFMETFGWSGAFIMVAGIALQCIPFGVIILCSREYYVTAREASANRMLLSKIRVIIPDVICYDTSYDTYDKVEYFISETVVRTFIAPSS